MKKVIENINEIRHADKDALVDIKVLYDLLFMLRTNMTSITRYVRNERVLHPHLTEGQFIDRNLEYKKLAKDAVNNILQYINGEQQE